MNDHDSTFRIITASKNKGKNTFFAGELQIETVKERLPQLNYYFVPVIIITLGAYFIADIFFGVYAMGVDTLFLCFLEVGPTTPPLQVLPQRA